MEANSLNFNIFNSLVLAGIVQGLIFGAIPLFSKKYRFSGTLLLACFIVSFSLDNLQYLLEDVGLITEEQLYSIWFVPFELLSGPLLLLYGLHVVNPDRNSKRLDRLLFLPFVIALVVTLVHKILYALGFVAPDRFFDMEAALEFIAIAIDFAAVLYLSVRAYRIDKIAASAQLRWFRIVLVLLLALSFVWFYITVADYFYETEHWYMLYISMSVLIYWMGHIGIYKFGVAPEQKRMRQLAVEHKNEDASAKQKNEHIVALQRLLVGEKRYLDPTITLDKIAQDLNLSKSHLSRIINAELGMGFPDYLNSLRVDEAKIYLRNTEFSNYTLLAIGLEAGFNSKTTFNTAFKKATSLTPSEYRNLG